LGTLADINGSTSGSGDGDLSVYRDPVGEHGGGSLNGDSEGKTNFQRMGCRFCRRASFSVGAPLGNMGRGSVYREL